jgi:hypothetical protein
MMAKLLFRIANSRTTSMSGKMIKAAISAGIVLVTFVLFWMNRFQYEHTGTTQVLVRINHFTGQECYLTTDRGWYGGQETTLPADLEKFRDGRQEHKNNCR